MVRGKATRNTKRKTKPNLRHLDLKLAIEYKPVAELVPCAKNARLHSDDQVKEIAASIAAFGFVNPVIVDADGEIVAGHGRVLAAKLLELEQVPTTQMAHLTQAEVKALRLFDNKSALNSKWDGPILAECLLELKSIGSVNGLHLPDLTGFDARELRSLTQPKDDKAKTEGYGGGEGKGAGLDVLVTCKSPEQHAELVSMLTVEGFEYKVVEK